MPERQEHPLLKLLPWVILALGLTLTYTLDHKVRDAARRALAQEFEFRVNEIVGNIDRRLHSYEQVLDGAAGLFAASTSVERDEFAAYVEKLKLQTKFPGIQGVGFAQWVPPAQKETHVAAVRAAGFPDYDLRPPGPRDAYTAILYLEPFDWRNRRAFGYDMYSEPVRREAMERARDEQTTAISGKVRLVQETERQVQPGFLMYLPVWRAHLPHATTEERRAALLGWVYAPFRMDDLMQGILGRHFGEISAALDLEIYDTAAPTPATLMFDSSPQPPRPASAFHASRVVSLFGRPWTIVVHSLPAFDARLDRHFADLIAGAGVAGSLLLALVFWLLLTGRRRAVVLAEHMTGELRESEARQRKLNRALRLLSACNMALVHAEEEYKLLVEICRLCVERGGYLMAWVGYTEHDAEKSVRPITQSGYEAGYLDSVNVTWADAERGRGPTGTAIRTGTTSVNQNVLENPRMAPWRDAALQRGYQSSVALPLLADGKAFGALTVYASEPFTFDAEEVALLEELAGDLAYGITTLRARAEHSAAKERVAFLAHFDPLTRLPNRLLLRDRFESAARVAQSDDATLAMLYLDIDHFSQINDGLGHGLGDELLLIAVERLRRCIGPADTLSRLSGDEFVILLTAPGDASGIAGVVNAIRDAFAEPIAVDGTGINVSFSIGISLFPENGEDFDTLLKCADTAVNYAKESGRNTYRFFARAMNRDFQEQMRLTGGLQRALRNQELVLYYQPQIEIASGRIIGAEALLRWQHPQDGLVPPGKFIPLAEKSGHIVPIGEWVLQDACRQARAWQERGLAPLVVAVNLSALQFKHGNVTEVVEAALAASGLDPAHLELELTESILLQDVEETLATLRDLKARGVKLSIDDFGTGYSSLAYLKHLAVNKLKIDQSFVRDMLTSTDGASIVRAIIQLGHSLQLTVIAEGVETAAHLDFLAEAGCDEAQGYLFSRPIPAEEFARLLAAPAIS